MRSFVAGSRLPRGFGCLAALALLGSTPAASRTEVAAGGPAPVGATLEISGPEEMVRDWYTARCPIPVDPVGNDVDVPDQPAAAYRLADGRVRLLASDHQNFIQQGRSLDSVRDTCASLHISAHDGDPSRFQDNEWVTAVEPIPDPVTTGAAEKYIAFVHDEYHGWEHASTAADDFPWRQAPSVYIDSCVQRPQGNAHCWYASTTYLLSNDGGQSFESPPPPANLIVSPPRPFSDSVTRIGRAGPLAIRNPKDGMLYLVIERIDGPDRGATQCLLRSPAGDGSTWQIWDGSGFVAPQDPYRAEGTTAPDCAPLANLRNVWSVKFVPALGSFIAFGQSGADLVYSFSPDLIQWEPRTVFSSFTAPGLGWVPGMAAPTYYYSLLDPGSDSPAFDTIGLHPYLYFVRWHVVGGQVLNHERDLLRVPIEITPRPGAPG